MHRDIKHSLRESAINLLMQRCYWLIIQLLLVTFLTIHASHRMGDKIGPYFIELNFERLLYLSYFIICRFNVVVEASDNDDPNPQTSTTLVIVNVRVSRHLTAPFILTKYDTHMLLYKWCFYKKVLSHSNAFFYWHIIYTCILPITNV